MQDKNGLYPSDYETGISNTINLDSPKKRFIKLYLESYPNGLTYQELNELLRIFKKHVYVCGQNENEHLAFRGISCKKHKDDFEKVKEFLK